MKFNSPMWITPLAPPPTALGKVHMAQCSVKFIRLNGAVLDENQHVSELKARMYGVEGHQEWHKVRA
jgi:hypothetical protein